MKPGDLLKIDMSACANTWKKTRAWENYRESTKILGHLQDGEIVIYVTTNDNCHRVISKFGVCDVFKEAVI
jgi:hypothetical protein